MNDPVVNIKDTDTISCSNCGKGLMVIYSRPATEEQKKILENHNQLLSKIQVDCAYCGDKSYDYEIRGPFKYHLVDGIKMTNFQQDGSKVRFSTKR